MEKSGVTEPRNCPVCGKRVVGRSDKQYCSDNCRVYASNARAKGRRADICNNREIYGIQQELLFLDKPKREKCIKLITLIIRFYKIILISGKNE